MKRFSFNIPNSCISGVRVIRPFYADVYYEIVDNKVVVLLVNIPYDILPYLNTTGHLHNLIYSAAENNALSYDLIKTAI